MLLVRDLACGEIPAFFEAQHTEPGQVDCSLVDMGHTGTFSSCYSPVLNA